MDRDQFKSRMSGLADVLSKFQIGDELPPGASRARGTLQQLRELLKVECGARDGEDALEAIDGLKKVVALRTALQHADRARQLRVGLEDLDVPVDPIDWNLAWQAVSATTIDGLRRIRAALRVGLDW